MSYLLRPTLWSLVLAAALVALPTATSAQDAEPSDDEATSSEDDASQDGQSSQSGDKSGADSSDGSSDGSGPAADPVERRSKQAPSTQSADDASFRIIYTPPRCLDSSGETTFSLASVLGRHFEINNGDFFRSSFGPASLSNGVETIFSEAGANDATAVSNLTEAGELEWTVVEEDFPALVSPWETVVQIPFRGHFDWLSIVETATGDAGRFPDTERVTGTLLRASLPDGKSLLRLDLPDRQQDPIFVRKEITTFEVDAPDDSVRIVSIGESLGRGSRIRPAVLDRLEASGADSSIVLHPGNVAVRGATDQHLGLCGEAARGLNPMALVPRDGELSLGPAGLAEFSSSYGLRYVAANLVARDSGERPFRRFSILNLEGLTIAVIGIVGSDQLDALPLEERKAWRLTDPIVALAEARADLETQLQRRADLTVVLLSTDSGEEYSRVSSVPEVDVVIGPFDRQDLVPIEERNTVPPGDFRQRRASVRVGGNPFGVGEVIARFESFGESRRPVSFVHRIYPVLDEGEIDGDLHRAFLPVENARVAAQSRLILPDLVPIFRSDAGIAALARDADTSSDDLPRGFSEPLWNRFVANELRRSFGADVAIVEDRPRQTPVVGAITAGQLTSWLDEGTQVRVVELTGTELAAIAAHRDGPDAQGLPSLTFSGFDPELRQIEGRRLRRDRPYRVVVTDTLVARDALDPIFGDETLAGRFRFEEGGWSADGDGRAVTIEDAVLGALGNDVVPAPELRRRLQDPAMTRDSEWRLTLRSVSMRARAFDNFGGQDYGATPETAVRVPDALDLGYRLDASLLYDSPLLAWQLDAFAQLDRLRFGEPAAEFEPYDELLAETELRGNALAFEIGDADFPLTPALSLAYDTEATPLSDATDPNGDDLARQQLVRMVPGLVAFPGDLLRRVDLGPVVQLDMVDGRADFGVEASYRLVFPVIGELEFESATTLRYLIPRSDEASDLALRIDSRNAFVHPLVAGFGLAIYGDVYLVQGNGDDNDGIGGLITGGAALRYNGDFRL